MASPTLYFDIKERSLLIATSVAAAAAQTVRVVLSMR